MNGSRKSPNRLSARTWGCATTRGTELASPSRAGCVANEPQGEAVLKALGPVSLSSAAVYLSTVVILCIDQALNTVKDDEFASSHDDHYDDDHTDDSHRLLAGGDDHGDDGAGTGRFTLVSRFVAVLWLVAHVFDLYFWWIRMMFGVRLVVAGPWSVPARRSCVSFLTFQVGASSSPARWLRYWSVRRLVHADVRFVEHAHCLWCGNANSFNAKCLAR